MKNKVQEIIRRAAQAIYQVDPSLQPYEDLLVEMTAGYEVRAQAALSSFPASIEEIIGKRGAA